LWKDEIQKKANISEICPRERTSRKSGSTAGSTDSGSVPGPGREGTSSSAAAGRAASAFPWRARGFASDAKPLLPPEHRLKKEKDFAKVAKSRKGAFSKHVSVKVRENGLPHSRFGIVVGTRISKKAVKRNALRRRIREILRAQLVRLRPGFDVMLMAQRSGLDAEYKELEQSVLSVLEKAGVMKKAA
jgi:ribonuclease P protein component